MREEELQSRLQRAFPMVAPPDEALHTRIQSLESRAKRSRRKRSRWKMTLVSVSAVSVGAIVVSRAMVGYVLFRNQSIPQSKTLQTKITWFVNSEPYRAETLWRVADKELKTYPLRHDAPTPSYSLIRDGKNYRWTQGKESSGDVTKILLPHSPLLVKAEQNNATGQSILVGLAPTVASWQQSTWSVPWVVRLPDRTSEGHREWVLQQTYPQEQTSDYWRTVWGVDAETGQLRWTEYWNRMGSSVEQLRMRTEFIYDAPIAQSIFEVPEGLKKKRVRGEYPVWYTAPVIKPRAMPFNWRKRWNAFLLGMP